MEETQEFVFKSIYNFVVALDSLQEEDKYDGTRCYRFLLEKTLHAKAIDVKLKHNALFKDYCLKHRDAIYARNASELRSDPITFSEKVYISFDVVFNHIGDDVQVLNSVFKHLMIIYIYSFPHDILMKEAYSTLINEDTQQLTLSETPARSVITELVDKLKVIAQSGEFDNVSNPMEIIQKMFTSKELQQVCKDTMEEMSSGRIAIPDLLSAVTSLQGTKKENAGLSLDGFDMNTINMLSSLFM